MMSVYSGAVRAALLDLFQLAVRLAMPLAILIGLAMVGMIIAYSRDPQGWKENLGGRKQGLAFLGAVIAVLAVGYVSWSTLQQLLPAARDRYAWQESTGATSKPRVDAPPVEQYGPVVAELQERTFTRSLTLPPDFVSRIGAEGIGVLAPYLQDPTAENVLRLVDTFRRNGQNVLFTREVTRLEEMPIALADATIDVKAHRRDEQTFDLDYKARYTFKNDKSEPMNARFQFPMPSSGSVKNLKVEIDGKVLQDPNEENLIEWTGTLAPNQSQVAVVSYQAVGGSAWRYDMGSTRRRVEKFALNMSSDGPVRFERGSLEPASYRGGEVKWNLDNVITGQKIALTFPANVIDRETFFQALEAMPWAVVLFALTAAALYLLRRREVPLGTLAIAIVILTLGFGLSMIVANYLGNTAGVLITPILGGILAGTVLRLGWLPAIAACLIPACFLSAEHTGLLLAIMIVIASFLAWRDFKKSPAAS